MSGSKSIISQDILNLYTKNARDIKVVPLTDECGIQIVRKYKSDSSLLSDKFMFINVYINDGYVLGNIDMVKQKESEERWTIVYPDKIKGLKNRFSNFSFWKDEGLIFDTTKKLILYKNKS